MISKDYKKVLPLRFHNASYENDVSAVAKKVMVDQIQARNGLFIYGEVGVGKTHIACAMAKEIMNNGFEVMFYNTGKFLEMLRNEFNKDFNENEDYKGLFQEAMDFKGILILDDIGAEKVSDWVIERLYLIINEKYESMIPVIFTSNCDKEILSARLGDRIVSRIAGMTVTLEIPGRDRRLTQ